jgi:hypothetical protein
MREGFWMEDKQRVANRHLKKVVWEAKHSWADEYITMVNIWEVVAWRHGRCSSHILALCNKDGCLIYKHEEMAELLSDCFFMEPGASPIPTYFHDDPLPRPT